MWEHENPDMCVTPERREALITRARAYYNQDTWGPISLIVEDLCKEYITYWREATYRWDSFVNWRLVELHWKTDRYSKSNVRLHGPSDKEYAMEMARKDHLFGSVSAPSLQHQFTLEEAEAWYESPKTNEPETSFMWYRWGFTPEEASGYHAARIRAPHIAYLYKRKGIDYKLVKRWREGVHGGMDAQYTPEAISDWLESNGPEITFERGPEWALACWNAYDSKTLKWNSLSFYQQYLHNFAQTNLEEGQILEWARIWGSAYWNAVAYSEFFDDPSEAFQWFLENRGAAGAAQALAYSKMEGLTPTEARKWDLSVGDPATLADYMETGMPFEWAFQAEADTQTKF